MREHDLPADPEGQRELIAGWHRRKTAIYKEMVQAGKLPGRPGVARIVSGGARRRLDARRGVDLAEESVRAVLEHVVGEEDAGASPSSRATSFPPRNPTRRSTSSPSSSRGRSLEAIVVEDSRNGLLAAVGAGLRCVVTVSGYTAREDMSEAVLVV